MKVEGQPGLAEITTIAIGMTDHDLVLMWTDPPTTFEPVTKIYRDSRPGETLVMPLLTQKEFEQDKGA